MSKANDNFDHLVRDKYGHKKIEGTYYAINKLEERIEKLENLIKDFMENWGPEVQEARSRRDEVWDEMVRVVSIQKKHQQPKPGYDIHGKVKSPEWIEPNEDVENH